MLSNYRLPGVYPESFVQRGAPATLVSPRVPVIIGRGSDTVTVVSDPVTKGSGDTDTFTSSAEAVEVLYAGRYRDAAEWSPGTDFTFSGSWSSPSNQITWNAGKGPSEGTQYYVTYKRKAPSTRYDFHLYYTEYDLVSTHGPENTTNVVAVGGVVAFRNGASAVGVIQLDFESVGYPLAPNEDPSEAALEAAFLQAIEKLKDLEPSQCRIVVPMTTSQSLLSHFVEHVYEMSLTSQRLWRVLFYGVSSSAGNNSTARDLAIDYATSVAGMSGASRVTICAPGEVQRQVRSGYSLTTYTFDGSVLAAAAAGKVCSFPNPAETITNKPIVGLSLLRQFGKQDRRLLGANGVTAFYTKGSQVVCSHWITPDLDDPVSQEGCIREVEDLVKWQCVEILESRFVGALITASMMAELEQTVVLILNELMELGVVRSFDNVTADVSSSDPRNLIVSFTILPAWPANWIDIKFTISTVS